MLRETDILFRYGGEEFLLVLPDTELQGAIFMLERLKLMLQKSPLHYQNQNIVATFSASTPATATAAQETTRARATATWESAPHPSAMLPSLAALARGWLILSDQGEECNAGT